MALIDKDTVVAEVNRRIEEITQTISLGNKKIQKSGGNRRAELVRFLFFLDTLEVKDVDLEKEVKNILDKYFYFPDEVIEIPKLVDITAKHFYELGLATHKTKEK